MKKSQLRKLIRESIKELMTEQFTSWDTQACGQCPGWMVGTSCHVVCNQIDPNVPPGCTQKIHATRCDWAYYYNWVVPNIPNNPGPQAYVHTQNPCVGITDFLQNSAQANAYKNWHCPGGANESWHYDKYDSSGNWITNNCSSQCVDPTLNPPPPPKTLLKISSTFIPPEKPPLAFPNC